MGFIEKIGNIRKKPEHIRVRYVWFFVTLSMLVVVIIWFFSLDDLRTKTQDSAAENSLFNSDVINQLGDQKEALETAKDQFDQALLESEQSVPVPPEETQNYNAQDNLNNDLQK